MTRENLHVPEPLRGSGARVAVVLGSGLGSFVDAVGKEAVVPFGNVPDHPVSRVPGHAGQLILARLGGLKVIIADGRVHLYEGWSAKEAARTVRLLHAAGIETLILTNAAGAVNASFSPGTWMMLSDHINLTGQSPLHGGPNFFDMSEVYSRDLRQVFRDCARAAGITLHEGVYAAMPGPQYETPAEIRMLHVLGADAVGMSTVPEAIQARALGMRVAGFSCLTNWGAGLAEATLNHEEVNAVGRNAAGAMVRLLESTLPKLGLDS